jgi:hypothetical protein
MKHSIVFILLVFIFCSFSQFLNASPKKQLDLNYNEKCKLIFKDGTAMSGYARSQTDSTLKFEKLDGTVLNLKTEDITGVISLIRYKFGSIGIGLGPQYGYVGANAEWEFWNYAGIYGGIGTIWGFETGYNAGLNLYIFNKESYLRPKITIMYGTNNIIDEYDYEQHKNINKVSTGFSIGLGTSFTIGEEGVIGMDATINFPITSEEDFDLRFYEISLYTIGVRFYL